MRYKDLSGKKFGRLTAVACVGRSVHGYMLWKCTCECGNTTTVSSGTLNRGASKSCGCLQKELNTRRHLDDLTGKKIGRWTVLERAGHNRGIKVLWKCRCDCGTEREVTANDLRSRSRSCGCLQKELAREQLKINNKNRVYEKGPEHRWWNPSLSAEDRKYQREPTETVNWRMAVFEKDDYTCCICSVRGSQLAAHHLVPYSSSVELRFALLNGVTLCDKCHRAYHSEYFGAKANPENFNEFKKQRQGALNGHSN